MSINIKASKGFSLAVVLLIVGAFAGILSGISATQQGRSIKNEAFLAGKEGALIARAARLYARNEITLNPNLVNELAPASLGPRDVSVGTLINLSLLPQNFARQDASGNYFNALGQRIRVILANFPVNGNPALSSTVPTAYVLFEDNAKSNPNLMQDVVQSMRTEQIPVSAPVYNGTTNVTGPCRGANLTVALWDSGCMRDTEYQILAGSAFVPGSFVIPAWRSVNFDSRAMMRFPQPEQAGLQTMLTDLSMGECGTGFIDIPAESGTQTTTICNPLDDDPAALVDNRRSFLNVQNVDGDSLIASPQLGDDVRTDNVTGVNTVSVNEVNALTIGSDLTAWGDAKVFNGDVFIANQTLARKNISVLNPAATIPPSAVTRSLNTGEMVSNSLNVNAQANFTNSDISVSGEIVNPSDVAVTQDFVARNIQKSAGIPGSQITVTNDAIISGTINPSNVTVSGTTNTNGYHYVTGTMAAVNLNAPANRLAISNAAAFGGTVTTANMAVTNAGGTANCEGDCPLREIAAQCQRLNDLGIEPFNTCMARFR